MTRRMLSIWLPRLAIERWLRARQGGRPARQGEGAGPPVPPAVLTETGARGTLITAATDPARQLGIAPGMRLTDARAILPSLGTSPHDRTADAALLEMMADAMLRFTPWVAMDGNDGLMLDVTGCAHLAGGEAALAGAVRTVFARAGFTARTGLAGTQGAAWALARHGRPDQIVTADIEATLAPLPVDALRLLPQTVDGLTRLGLKSIGDLTRIDRASLMRRFQPGRDDPGPVARLDQALGRRDEPLSPRTEAPDYRVRVSPLEPLIDLAGIRHHFGELLPSLLATLATDGRGARRLTLHAFRCDGPVIRIEIGLARASREAPHVSRLFEEKLDSIDPGFGVDTLMLSADVTEPMTARQATLEPERDAAAPDALERLTDRIANRLGPDSIYRLAPVQSHVPDRAVRRAPALAAPSADRARKGRGPGSGQEVSGKPAPASNEAEMAAQHEIAVPTAGHGSTPIASLTPTATHAVTHAAHAPAHAGSGQFDSNIKQKTATPTLPVNDPLTTSGGKMKGGWEGNVRNFRDPPKAFEIKENLLRNKPSGAAPGLPLRPLTLLARPEPVAVMAEIPEGPPLSFRWRRVLHRVTRATGPERIAPEWWRDLADRTRTRDYYAIEDAAGGRYWMFRDGLYHEADQRGAPEWFLHGMFA